MEIQLIYVSYYHSIVITLLNLAMLVINSILTGNFAGAALGALLASILPVSIWLNCKNIIDIMKEMNNGINVSVQ